jgi:6,7-dimethyl-8-ribityllumazine synthase
MSGPGGEPREMDVPNGLRPGVVTPRLPGMLPSQKIGGPRVLGTGSRRNYTIVASQYNPKFVQGLVDNTARELTRLAPASRIVLHQVPGAFEIPVIVQEIATKPKSDVHAIIALGVILQGETDHATNIARSVTYALQQIALASRMPVIHEVLSCKDEAQAQVRCLDPELNRGLEAARAAVSLATLIAQLRE